MIEFNYQKEFEFNNSNDISGWLSGAIKDENYKEDAINYIFCDDIYLLELNVKHLEHNTLTDIITFDYNLGKLISSDIFISVDRVLENSVKYAVNFDDELNRVMIHGILHLCGYKDKTKEEKLLMREKEDYYLSLRTFK
ncbi:rRNA maturation RNase YbeY [Aureibaculum sp. A20]|uniref:Endoribonuclease YbeY n=1 Tax=Aureibaculum flavum TaxID=2795986 RepID=A0ABS0WQ78_9FLAO|nr:rRNA maturation RNase YbeY [Aureibaculum flavum]MBJ2174130.1 rRNA maturation RNase YbeY [Aureibaculum flavum]